ncbi:MAG: DUF4476 domain-containing protein [Bacteroidetes bacterium]|nr:DUF4476 domain-containing protein [Bacteroidota bacterium]
MKPHILAFGVALFICISANLLISTSGFAQNNLVIFSEQGEQFYVVLNGIKQNAKPETNVKVTGLMQPMVSTKIIFADGKTPDLDQKVYLMSGGNEVQGYEFVYALKMKKGTTAKGSDSAMTEGGLIGVAGNLKKVDKGYKLAYRSEAVIAQAPPTQGQTVIVYSTVPPPVNQSTTTSVTTTTTGTAPTGDHVNVGMNAPGVNFNMNVNVNDGSSNSSSTSTMTSTTTSSTTTSGSGGTVYVLPGYSGPNNCPWPMSPPDFESAKASIKAKSFEDSKLTMAKQILGSNCLLSSQVKEIMLVFSFEDTRLDLAKLAWGKTFDPGNYYKLNDAFTFESSIDDLNRYIEGRK